MSDILKVLLILAFLMTIIVGPVTAETLQSGECKNITSTLWNETTNSTYSITNTICCPENVTCEVCKINATIGWNETYTKNVGSCDVDVKCIPTEDMLSYPFDILIEADEEHIRVTYKGTTTESFPRTSESFSYFIEDMMECPSVGIACEDIEYTYEQCREHMPYFVDLLKICTSSIDSIGNITDNCRAKLLSCDTERGDYKVEWETRGKEIATKDEKISELQEELKESEDDSRIKGYALIVVIVLLVILGVFATIMTLNNLKFHKQRE